MKADCASQGEALELSPEAGRAEEVVAPAGGRRWWWWWWARLAGRGVRDVAHAEALSPRVSTLMTSACALMSSPC